MTTRSTQKSGAALARGVSAAITQAVAPTLETERLILRPHRMQDFEDLATVLATPHARFMGGPKTRDETWLSFCSDIAQWPLLGHGAWAVDQRDTGDFIGQISIIQQPNFPEVEIGWIFLPQVQGNGFAQEAASAALTFAFASLGLATLVSYIDAKNTRSIRLAVRLGAAPDPAAALPYPDNIVYRHPHPEARQ
jgi:RimJ/RimL family protein N-acetyltransferase